MVFLSYRRNWLGCSWFWEPEVGSSNLLTPILIPRLVLRSTPAQQGAKEDGSNPLTPILPFFAGMRPRSCRHLSGKKG